MDEELPPKDTFAERYRIISPIGRGGMGSVWRGEHLTLGTPVAVKLLEKHLANRPMIRARFLREARAAATLRSKHVVQILDHGVEDGIPFIVMECLEGESLGTRLRRDRVLDPGAAMRIFSEIGIAIGRAHKLGIVHRDLKPDNVFLARDEDDREVVKVVDFGIAKVLEEEEGNELSTDTGAMLGTPYYMSPEQARGIKPIDQRADLWAMAVMAFECVVGRRPFVATAVGELVLQICADAPPVPSTLGDVPPGFDAWFARSTQRGIDDRFTTVEELVAALRDVLTPGEPLASDPTPSEERPPSGATRASPDLETDPTVLADGSAKTEDSTVRSLVPETSASRPMSRTVLLGGGALAAAAAIVWGLTRPSSTTPSGAANAPAPTAQTSSAQSETSASAPVPPSASVAATTSIATASPSASTSTSAANAGSTVELTISANEPDAEVYDGNERVGTTGTPFQLRRSDVPVTLSIRKKGFSPVKKTVVPDRDRRETVELKRNPGDKEYLF